MTPHHTHKVGRNTAIDNLRVAMMCVVMLGHPLLPYTTVPRRFQDAQAHVAFDVLGVFLYSFAMPAFFVTAGFAGAALYHRKGASAFWANRVTRILLPLLVGYILLSPLTRAAYDFAQATATTQQWSAGWEAVRSGDWVRWSKAYHLWFLASLLVFSALTLVLRRMVATLPATAQDALAALGRGMITGRSHLWLLSGWASAFMIPSYGWGTGQGTDLWMQFAVFSFFGLGWLLQSHTEALAHYARRWRHAGAIGICVTPVCAWATLKRLHAEEQIDLLSGTIAGISNALLAVSMSLALLGLFHRHASGRGPLMGYISDASYWIYLIHFPIVITAGGLVSVTQWPAAIKYGVVLAISLPLILGSYALFVRHSPLGRVLGGAGRRPANR